MASRTVKRSITLDRDLEIELKQWFAPGELSRFLNEAARDALARRKLTALLDRMDQEYGPIPDEIVEEVRRMPRPE